MDMLIGSKNLQASPQLCLDVQLIGLYLCVFKRLPCKLAPGKPVHSRTAA